MAGLSEDDYQTVRREMDRWIAEQDGDLMVAGLATDLLIAAERDGRFDRNEQQFLITSLLVQRYDAKRKTPPDHEALAKLEDWIQKRLPKDLDPNVPDQDLLR